MPEKTAEIIVDSGNNYTLGVKKNQPALLKNIKDIISSEKPTDSTANIDKNRGRIELRETSVYNAPKSLTKDWKGINKIIKVHKDYKTK